MPKTTGSNNDTTKSTSAVDTLVSQIQLLREGSLSSVTTKTCRIRTEGDSIVIEAKKDERPEQALTEY